MTKFKTNNNLKKLLYDIYDRVSNKKIIRIGQSGTGKTRCVFEAFNRQGNEAVVKQSSNYVLITLKDS